MKQLRRFYKEARAAADGSVELDGKTVKTPFKRRLRLPKPGLAEAVAAEWQAQGDKIDPTSMPLTRLANMAIDGVAADRVIVAAEILAYANHDLTLFRATTPEGLVAREAAAWDPVVDWARRTLGGAFEPVIGIARRLAPPSDIAAVESRLGGFDEFELAALHEFTRLTGSALAALMLEAGDATADEVWQAAHVEEDWQIAQWGSDAEAEARRARRHHAFTAAVRFLQLAGA